MSVIHSKRCLICELHPGVPIVSGTGFPSNRNMLNVIDVAIKVKPKHRAAPSRNPRKTKPKNASKQDPAPSVSTVPQTVQPVLTVFQTVMYTVFKRCSCVVTVFQTVFPSSRSESGPNKNTAPRAVITDTAQKAVSPLLREQLLCRGASYPNPYLRCHPRQPRQLPIDHTSLG